MYRTYLQIERPWRKIPLGSSRLTIAQAGCAVCCLAMWLQDRYNKIITPREVNYILRDADNGFIDTNLLNWSVLPEIFDGVKYEGRKDWPKPVPDEEMLEIEKYLPCIIYVDYNPKEKGLQQHFVYLQDMSWNIKDPMKGDINLIPTYGKSPNLAIWGMIKLNF